MIYNPLRTTRITQAFSRRGSQRGSYLNGEFQDFKGKQKYRLAYDSNC